MINDAEFMIDPQGEYARARPRRQERAGRPGAGSPWSRPFHFQPETKNENMAQSNIIHINGSMGEGGGQILRSSLALSMFTGRPFSITNIRAGRNKPGLMRQHLTAVNAACSVSGGEAKGAELHSQELHFTPGEVKPGRYQFAVGTAGSATLVLQTVLPALLTAGGPSELVLEGGTHNPFAPPFDFLERVFLPLVQQMGPKFKARLEKPGFFPAGGGRFIINISPVSALSPLELMERGDMIHRKARAVVANLDEKIARRELLTVKKRLDWAENELESHIVAKSDGPGNVLLLEQKYAHVTELFTGFGMKKVRAESVAQKTCKQLEKYEASHAPVGAHLADQLLIPLAMAGSGRFCTVTPTEHTKTNALVVEKFFNVSIRITERKTDYQQPQFEVSVMNNTR